MRRTATVASKGQVTIPVEVRRRLGPKQGDRVAFQVADGTAWRRTAEDAARRTSHQTVT